MSAVRVILAAGGTGGHVFPAIGLAEALSKRGHSVLCLTDTRAIDLQPSVRSWDVKCIPAISFSGRGIRPKIRAFWTLIKGIFLSQYFIKKFDAEIVVGFGGYPTVAPIIAAFISRSIVILHEQNAVLGRANRWLSSVAHIIATSFELTRGLNDKHSKTVMVGNPVRNEMKKARSSSYPIIKADNKINILVIGGSAGAKILSDTVPKALLLLPTSLRKNLLITQQCREEDLSRVVAIYKTAKQKSDIKTFFDDISEKIKNSHLVISRSGASTVAELSVIGRPAILIPYQFAIDNHQKINADAMVKSGGAWSFDESNLQPKTLANFLEEILTDHEKLRSAAHASRNFGTPKSSEVLADLISQITKTNISELKSKFKQANTAQKLGGDYEKTPN